MAVFPSLGRANPPMTTNHARVHCYGDPQIHVVGTTFDIRTNKSIDQSTCSKIWTATTLLTSMALRAASLPHLFHRNDKRETLT